MSIQALADSLGLSTSTVSRALNGYADVSAKTRARVEAAASAMNYQPHPMAHRLATGKTGAIALLTSMRGGNYLEASFTALVSGVAEVLRAQKLFTMSVGIPTGDDEISELERFLSARLVDGIILTRTRTHDPRVALLQARGMPFVTYGRTMDNAPHAWVDTDNVGAFEQATSQLIALGHRRIALINGMPNMAFAVLRQQGFEQALHKAGIALDTCPVHYTELNGASGAHVMERLLSAVPRPSAVLCAIDGLALGAYQSIKKAGLLVGSDISVMGYGNTEAGEFADPPLASMDHAIAENGRHLAQTLLQVMGGADPASLNLLEKPKLLMRASAGKSISN
jgi:LacI family transcriptional regulator